MLFVQVHALAVRSPTERYKLERTEEHTGVEVSFTSGPFTKIHYGTILTASLWITFQGERDTCGLRYLCSKW